MDALQLLADVEKWFQVNVIMAKVNENSLISGTIMEIQFGNNRGDSLICSLSHDRETNIIRALIIKRLLLRKYVMIRYTQAI